MSGSGVNPPEARTAGGWRAALLRFVGYWGTAFVAQLPTGGPVDYKAVSGAAVGALVTAAEHCAPAILGWLARRRS